MKLDKFAAAIGEGHDKRRMAATSEQRRKVLHMAWLDDVYPHWQGPIAVLVKQPGVTDVRQHPVQHFPEAANGHEIARDIAAAEGRSIDWPAGWMGEVIEVGTATELGVSASILYAMTGDENDCVAARMLAFHDMGASRRVIESSRVATWTGSLEAVIAKMADDVDRAADLVDDMLLAALGARTARIAEEKRQAEAAERKRLDDEAARVKAESDDKRRKEEAALAESRRAEAAAQEAAAVPEAVPAPSEAAVAEMPPPGGKRRK